MTPNMDDLVVRSSDLVCGGGGGGGGKVKAILTDLRVVRERREAFF